MGNFENRPHKIAFAVFACNESVVIQDTVKSICAVMRDSDAVFVVADNCTDNTARLAADAGASVLIRKNEWMKGKGAAIRWFIQSHWNDLRSFDQIIILDADSLLPSDFMKKLEPYLDKNFSVGQCFVSPKNDQGSQIGALIALSELLEQSVFDRLRSAFSLSVRLRGTGMVFPPQLLLRLCQQIDTEVEDIVFCLLLAEQKIIVRQLASACVYDPKPGEIAAASNQRARWFRGQNVVLWKYRKSILKTSLSGVNGWSVLISIFFKPRWLQLLILFLLGLIFIHNPFLAAPFFIVLSIEILLLMIGFLSLNNRKDFCKALLFVPAFIVMWIKGILLSFQRHSWLRVRGKTSSVNEYVMSPHREEIVK
jgi:cellulose synthase/poly-beta-1,6-N-acetylglucosamine synthase-like glycosyltransferase